MKKKKSPYQSLKHKNFRQAFIQMLETDFSLIGSGQVLDLLAANTIGLIEHYMPERIIPGKTVVSAISKDAPKGHHRGVKSLPQVPIELDIVNEEILNRYAEGDKLRDVKRDHVINLFKQAYNQGGVLSSADVAIVTKMSSATISKYVREHMDENGDIVPTRGLIHDIGPTISHKGIIVGKFLKGELPSDIAKRVNHSQRAVDRYIKDYERVKICLKQRMETKIIGRATGMSKRLIEKYKELYDEYEGEKNAS